MTPSILGFLVHLLSLVLAPGPTTSDAPGPASLVVQVRPEAGVSASWSAAESDPDEAESCPLSEDEDDNDVEDDLVLVPSCAVDCAPVRSAPLTAEPLRLPIRSAADPRAPRAPPLA